MSGRIAAVTGARNSSQAASHHACAACRHHASFTSAAGVTARNGARRMVGHLVALASYAVVPFVLTAGA